MIERRKFLTGLISLVAAPAIVRVTNIMPVKIMAAPYEHWVQRVSRERLETLVRPPLVGAGLPPSIHPSRVTYSVAHRICDAYEKEQAAWERMWRTGVLSEGLEHCRMFNPMVRRDPTA